ncbi:MAG: kelch repeat-containing protein, partial [Kangiellaceae bacterium]|nr:kelch repeat-containing protein [Kangiellaceae bacterium]
MKWLDHPHIHDAPKIKNHTAVPYNNLIYIFGGYDGKKNHNILYILDTETSRWTKVRPKGTEPLGRNGHTATVI